MCICLYFLGTHACRMISGTVIFLAALSVAASSDANLDRVGQCEFFANGQASCTGKLRCRTQSTTGKDLPVDTLCPGAVERADGTWNLNQGIIPAIFSRVPSSSELVAKCDFYTNSSFVCVSGPNLNRGNFWDGTYTGSLNAAFGLGLDKWSFLQRTPATTTTTTSTVRPHIPSYVRESEREDGYNRNGLRDGEDNEETQTQVNLLKSEEAVNEVKISEVEKTENQRQRNNVGVDDDRVNHNVHYSVRSERAVICEYFANGWVGCRDCTEKPQRGSNNRRDYNCSNPPNGPPLKSWAADNGIVPLTPDPGAPPKTVAATCIFERWSNFYECLANSALCPEDSRSDTNKCLSGKRWNGEYHGTFDFLLSS